MKTCIECKQNLSLDNFSFKDKQRGKYQSRCKSCYNEYNRAYYKAGERTNQIQRSSQNNKKLRQKLAEWKSQRGCCLCTENASECLDLHHLDPLEKEGTMGSFWTWEKIMEEATKCIVVCSNCHRKIHSGRITTPR